jgi:hypothetical protein
MRYYAAMISRRPELPSSRAQHCCSRKVDVAICLPAARRQQKINAMTRFSADWSADTSWCCITKYRLNASTCTIQRLRWLRKGKQYCLALSTVSWTSSGNYSAQLTGGVRTLGEVAAPTRAKKTLTKLPSLCSPSRRTTPTRTTAPPPFDPRFVRISIPLHIL